MRVHRLFSLVVFVEAVSLVRAFAPLSHTPSIARCNGSIRQNGAALRPNQMVTELVSAAGTVDAAVVDEARTAFFFWLFGASGGAGIARSAFPRMYGKFTELNEIKDMGPTKQGDVLDISPLCGYPRPIYKADIEQILNQKLTVEQIVQKFPIEGNFLSARGYLTYQAFTMANKGANPLTLRVVFDSLNTSSDVCSPDIAQERLDAYKTDLNALATSVLWSKLKGYSAIFGLLFLLALADYEAFVVHFRTGWFPEWPGLSNLPFSLFDPEIGLTSIPKYWLDEY